MIPYSTQTIDDSDIAAVVEALKSERLTQGDYIDKFEHALEAVTGAKYAIAVSSGSAALHLALLALNLNKGDLVITTVNSFAATANAILYAGATPKFVDVDETGNIKLYDMLVAAQDPKVKAVIPVSFGGRFTPEYYQELRNKGVRIIEDAAHSLGAMDYYRKRSGGCDYTDMAILSFHPVKAITTAEGGAITTNDYHLAKRLKRLRSHGIVRECFSQPWVYDMVELGYHYRMNELQAALGLSQLEKLSDFIDRRIEIAERYHDRLKHPKIKFRHPFDANSAYHLFVILCDFSEKPREQVMKELQALYGIGTQVHYQPINRFSYYRSLGFGREYTPNMETYYKSCLSIPCHPKMTDEEVDHVIACLNEVL